MYNFLAKRGQLLAFLLGVAVVAIYLITVFGGLEEFSLLSDEDKKTSDLFNIGIILTRLMIVICAILFFVTVVIGFITHPRGSLRMLIAIAAVAILFAIFYSTATMDTSARLENVIDKFGLTANNVKIVTGGLKTAIVLILGTFAVFIVMEIVNLFK